MAERVKLIGMNGEAGIIIPNAILERFGLEEGDEVKTAIDEDVMRFDLTASEDTA